MYRIRHPVTSSTSFTSKISPKRIIHNLGWMRAMVTGDEAREAFGRTFSRPPRLLFTNPVAFLFSAYYAYIYGQLIIPRRTSFTDVDSGIIYVSIVSIPLLFGSPPFSRPGLFSYHWPQSTLSLSYLGLCEWSRLLVRYVVDPSLHSHRLCYLRHDCCERSR